MKEPERDLEVKKRESYYAAHESVSTSPLTATGVDVRYSHWSSAASDLLGVVTQRRMHFCLENKMKFASASMSLTFC